MNTLIRVKARVKGITGYINAMRPTWLSNPYSLDEYNDYSLEQCLIDYEDFLRCNLDMDESYAKRFDLIPENSTIGCTCKPDSRCHVDIIIKIWNERRKTVVTLECPSCHKDCERMQQGNHDWVYICCLCSGSYIDSLCDTCESRKKGG